MEASQRFRIVEATPDDVGPIVDMIEALAEYEKLRHLCVVTEARLHAALFGARPAAEVVIGREGSIPVAFALFFHNFSTFLGQRGLYLEDLFVRPPFRRRGYGRGRDERETKNGAQHNREASHDPHCTEPSRRLPRGCS